MKFQRIISLLTIGVVGLLIAFSIYSFHAPTAQPASAPGDAFSAERAMAHVRAIASKPHPMGTAACAAAREYIMDQIKACGETPEIQRVFVNYFPGRAAMAKNILARVKGTNSSRAVALMAHYDSVPFGPGAADDTSGVAALLETLRAIKSGKPLKNDVIFLFTDGEEGAGPNSGLIGAWGFSHEHPWVKDIGVLLNFDCRGTHGPSYMYETSPGNGWLIQQFLEATGHPFATSFSYDISSRMPTGSDFQAFRTVGVEGLNFAFIDGVTRYHTELDNVDNLDPRSLEHHGEYALSLARRFGNATFPTVLQKDVIYFTLPFQGVYFWYPQILVKPLALITLIFFIIVIQIGVRRQMLTVPGVWRGAGLFLIGVIVPVVAAALVAFAGYQIRGPYILYSGDPLMAALAMFAVCVMAVIVARTSRPMELAAGALMCWALLLCVSSGFLPGASYMFTWPLLFSTAGFLYLLLRPNAVFSKAAVLIVTAIPGIFVVIPITYGLYSGVTIIFSAGIILIEALVLGLLLPHLHFAKSSGKYWLPVLSGVACLAFLGIAFFSAGFNPAHPKLTSLSYALDAETGAAFWLSSDKQPDEWTSQFFPKDTPLASIKEFLPETEKDPDGFTRFLKAKAPVVPLPAPRVEKISDTTENDVRHLRLRIQTQRQASRVALYAENAPEIIGAAVDGIPLKPIEYQATTWPQKNQWFLSYDIFPPEGIELAIDMKPGPLELRAVDHLFQLPEPPKDVYKSRPDYMIVKPNTVDFNLCPLKSNETMVAAAYSF